MFEPCVVYHDYFVWALCFWILTIEGTARAMDLWLSLLLCLVSTVQSILQTPEMEIQLFPEVNFTSFSSLGESSWFALELYGEMLFSVLKLHSITSCKLMSYGFSSKIWSIPTFCEAELRLVCKLIWLYQYLKFAFNSWKVVFLANYHREKGALG
jgi:hypothetical protein